MEYSLADIAAATKGSNAEGMEAWMNNPFMYFIFLAWMNGGGFGGFGNGNVLNGVLTRAELYDGLNANQLQNDTRDIERSIASMNTVNLQGQCDIKSAIAQASFSAQNCCCETNRNIDALRYETQKQTCDITTAIHAEGEATRALITQNTIQALRDSLADRDRELMTANFQLSQQAQSASLISSLRPFPQPAYITCSPYQSAAGYGFGCGCGC